MKRHLKLKGLCVVLALAAFPFFYAACGGASAPSAPAELPTPIVLKFVEPSQLRVNLDTIAPTSSISVYHSINPGGEFGDVITFGPPFVEGAEEIIAQTLEGISVMEIPISENTTTFEDTVTFSSATGFLAGTHDVKIDFGNYDFDNDGMAEGCLGHTAALPICVRMWLDGERYLAWIFDQYPSDLTVGQSRFKVFIEDGSDFTTSVAINFKEDVSTQRLDIEEYLKAVRIRPDEDIGFLDIIAAFQEFNWHLTTYQEGPLGSEFKNANLNAYFDIDDPNSSQKGYWRFKWLGQFIEDENFWSGALLKEAEFEGIPPLSQLEEDICAELPSGNGADVGECRDLGIFTEGIPFASDFTDAAVAVPNDFPETPTF